MHCARVMLVDPAGQRVALVAEGGVLSLPKVIATGTEGVDLAAAVGVRTPPTDGEALAAWIAKCAPVTVLASLVEVNDETAGEKSTVTLYLCELGPAAVLSDMADGWWTAGEDDLPDLPAALNAALRFTLSILEHGDAADGPWSFFNLPGTTAALADILQATPAAAAVATMCVDSADVRATDLRQLRGWWLSSVWHNDDVVFKVTHPNWPAEPAVNELLGSWRPEHVETLVASGFHTAPGHRPTPWLLQRRIKARPRDQDQDPDTAQAEQLRLSVATVAALARIQLTCQGREAELLAAGVADRFLDATRAALPRLWAAEELASLEPAERAALPLLEKSILKRLDALAELGTTPLLAHGDLHLGNVIETESGELKLIDWTDAALTWPGVDLLTLLPRSSEHHDRESIVAAYEAALGDRLSLAVRPGLDLADVFHAISYANIDAFLPRSGRWELGGTVTHLVRRQLELVMA